ncbi:MAG: hypothetical protein RL011_1295 [Pseudomonadota bacterium]
MSSGGERAVAQLVARTLGVREVVSSNLAGPTIHRSSAESANLCNYYHNIAVLKTM